MIQLLVTFIILVQINTICGYSTYQDRIPNGHKVPHPCKENFIWHGVGHKNAMGGGSRNQFGEDFVEAGKHWTVSLCRADSDGDGRSNGEELGDPHCIWSEGDVPTKSTDITHPGICDSSTNGEVCTGRDDWVDCEHGEFSCPATEQQGVKNITVRFNNPAVPRKETIYKCLMFDIPSDDDYHMIAAEALIDNRKVAHHMVVFACDPSKTAELSDIPTNVAYDCGMAPHKYCKAIIFVWTLGYSGNCLDDNIGVRVGSAGFTKAAIQIHWNNPLLIPDMTDSSGFKFYYTSNRRPNDIVMITIGQEYLRLTPHQDTIEYSGECSSECSEFSLSDPVYIVSALNHMHYAGRKSRVEVYRAGSLIHTLANDEIYLYDRPQMHRMTEPIEIRPGDQLKVICVFNTEGSTKTVYWGDGTANEMCYSFLTVYPASSVIKPICTSWKSIPQCLLYNDEFMDTPIQGCKRSSYETNRDYHAAYLYMQVEQNCRAFDPCSPECLTAVRNFFQNPCFKGDMWHHFQLKFQHLTPDIFLKIASCAPGIDGNNYSNIMNQSSSSMGYSNILIFWPVFIPVTLLFSWKLTI